VAKPAGMDGKSVIPLLIDAADPAVPRATRAHVESFGASAAAYRSAWRDSIFIEYYYGLVVAWRRWGWWLVLAFFFLLNKKSYS
jgi:hypothetical protein